MESNPTTYEKDFKKDNLDLTISLATKEKSIEFKIKDNQGFSSEYSNPFALSFFTEQSNYFKLFEDISEIFPFLKEGLTQDRVSFIKETNSLLVQLEYRG